MRARPFCQRKRQCFALRLTEAAASGMLTADMAGKDRRFIRAVAAMCDGADEYVDYFTVTTVDSLKDSSVSSWPRPGSSGTSYMPFFGI